jgi:hypothetical protein
MHQEIELPGIGDVVEFCGARLPDDIPQASLDNLREYDGSIGVIVGLFSDSRKVKCATVEVSSENTRRKGRRYFPLAALKKHEPSE